jgi:hypothetical protein
MPRRRFEGLTMTESTMGSSPAPRDGRYEGGNNDDFLELRVDRARGIISGDVFAAGAVPRDYLASFRTVAGTAPDEDGRHDILWVSSDGRTADGQMTVTPVDDETATVRLRAGRQLNGLSAGELAELTVRWQAAEFRRIDVEQETEDGVVMPDSAEVNGLSLSFAGMMAGAGFDVGLAGRPSAIPHSDDGWEWNEANVFSVLSTQMAKYSQADLTHPAWQVHTLALSRSTNKGVYGVMFDVTGSLPRQGCALFVDAIRDAVADPAEQNRQILSVLAHEVGHSLNLVHRFERALGRSDSISLMNYPTEYLGGGQPDAYWKLFRGTFDDDELDFLRHGPRNDVMPGTAPFHSIDYWDAAPGSHPPYVPTVPTPGLELTLEPPPSGAHFAYGQPIMLQATLRNTGTTTIALPPDPLDVKAGNLEILVERNPDPGVSALGRAQSFAPMMQRCIVNLTPGPRPFPPGASMSRNVSIGFGTGGFVMADPGLYGLTLLLTVTDPRGRGSVQVIRGERLDVRVGFPEDGDHQRHASQLLSPDAGAWLALGGGSAFVGVPRRLDEIRRARKSGGRGRPDALTAAITRTLAIHWSRPYLQWDGSRFATRPARPGRAAKLLRGLVADQDAMAFFDPATARNTRELARSLE